MQLRNSARSDQGKLGSKRSILQHPPHGAFTTDHGALREINEAPLSKISHHAAFKPSPNPANPPDILFACPFYMPTDDSLGDCRPDVAPIGRSLLIVGPDDARGLLYRLSFASDGVERFFSSCKGRSGSLHNAVIPCTQNCYFGIYLKQGDFNRHAKLSWLKTFSVSFFCYGRCCVHSSFAPTPLSIMVQSAVGLKPAPWRI